MAWLRTAFVTLPLAVLWLGGCASDNLLPSNGVTSEAKTTGNAAAYASSGAGEAETQEPFNPFADATSVAAAGGRDVIANPTAEDVMMTGTLPDMSLGRTDAPVTIVEYASLTCPHCRRFHIETFPELKRAYIDTGKVRFILREFPIGRTSGNATIALRCAPPGKYFDLFGKYLTQQASWVSQDVRLDPIFDVAKQVGMTRAQFDACLQNQAMIDGLKWVKDRGRKLGVIGTPNFFVQGKLVKNVLSMAEIRAMADPLLAAQGPAATTAQR